MISTVTTTTVTTVTTVTSVAASDPVGAFSLVASLALVGYLCTKEVLGAKGKGLDDVCKQLYVSVLPLSIAFAVWTVVKIVAQIKL